MHNTTSRNDFSSPRLLTATQVATIAQLPVSTIYEHARTGLLPCVRIGRAVRFRFQDIDEFLQRGGQAFAHGWRKDVA